jgi:hypothetical protein
LLSDMRKIGGLDLARRVDHSALVLGDLDAGGLCVTYALRLPRGLAYADQIAAIQPSLVSLDLLAYDASGVGDAVGEFLTPIMAAGCLVPVVITGGTGAPAAIASGGRIAAPKAWLIGNILGLLAERRLVVAPDAPGRGDPLHQGWRCGGQRHRGGFLAWSYAGAYLVSSGEPGPPPAGDGRCPQPLCGVVAAIGRAHV